MPQMSPINWLSLFIIFSITFVIFNMMNYFNFFPSTPKSHFPKNKINNSMNWKW
uniref:ATP synthase complex subunit 8 n=1 Tax=Cephenemyia stimulator TaxID=170895 RepID=A0A8A4YRU2_CEPST|nr:ATP synthase F0 subunit 8 [Cephenemyia stimulator]QTE20631.1 ATP synthase F0 subunit 8 [Cephenemyia stimulator]